ncbi:MAG: hypothetical protein JWR26_1290 [Pedosphaera sp.]|nr:hypothetical protein [Pedosphaera sp.]
MNTQNSSWRVREKTGPLTEGHGDACARVLTHGHQGKSLGRWMGLVLWAPRARCHLSPAQWLPKPATSQLPEKRRSLRELWSASQQGTGRCLRTATGEDLKRMVVNTCFDVAWALGCFGAVGAVDMVDGMDDLDAKDQEDRRDERLRLEHGQRVVWQARMGQCPGLSPIVPECPELSGGVFMFFFSGVYQPAGGDVHSAFGPGRGNGTQSPAITRDHPG